MAGKHKKSFSGKEMSKRPAKDDYCEEDDEEPELTDTIFLRNLATFDTSQESLKVYIEKNFGETVYCLICKDKETGMSKGTAFVKFTSPETAQKCLDEFGDPELQTKFFLDGRNIFVLPALSRDKISEVKRAKAPSVEAEDGPKKKKKPRQYRPQTKISTETENSNLSSGPGKKQAYHDRSQGNNRASTRKGKDQKWKKQISKPSKNGGKSTSGKKVKKNLAKKKKAMTEKTSHKPRGRH